jgi:methylisocitrate lyase
LIGKEADFFHKSRVKNSKLQTLSPGARFRKALEQEIPLQVVGTINAYAAIMAEKVGYRALYLSGAGVANSSYGLPDLGLTSLADVLEDVKRVAGATKLPVLVDADTGWGDISKTVKGMIKAGAAGIHLEDQIAVKRCGHRPKKHVVSTEEMVDRITAAIESRTDPEFVIMARTDAVAVEGMKGAMKRVERYCEAGADMIFPEALPSLEEYRNFAKAAGIPILANITEFGKTPLFTKKQLARAGVRMILYPLSAFRAMNAAALRVFQEIRQKGTQRGVVSTMQTRAELYDFLNYWDYEKMIDQLIELEMKEKRKK